MAGNDISALLAAARGERVQGPLDAATLDAAASARMLGLLARAAVDPPRELQLHAVAIESRALSLLGELARIAAAFRDAGIPLLALKGPVASQQLYGDPGVRVFADLDMIVDVHDVGRGEALLATLGYVDEEPMTPAQRATKHRFHNGTAFRNAERATTVDFHWRFGHVQFPLALPFADAWRRRTNVLGMPALGPTDLAIFTCSHSAKHFWTPLEMLAQIAALTRLEVDWQEVDRVAARARAARQVGLSFLVAHEVVGSDLPPLPRCLAASEPVFARLQQRLERPHDVDPRGRDLFTILDRRRDAIAAAMASVFVPTHTDWAAAKLPHALYWVLRPFRLAAARLRR
ncbi:MAG TPA: nucleotidyltransferase family protein [Thermoanaerobaculia bacterium]|jgi:hypothetical protein